MYNCICRLYLHLSKIWIVLFKESVTLLTCLRMSYLQRLMWCLYCGIPHDFALCALKDFLLDRNLPAIVNGIHNMMELVLKKNVSEFNYECFLQASGRWPDIVYVLTFSDPADRL